MSLKKVLRSNWKNQTQNHIIARNQPKRVWIENTMDEVVSSIPVVEKLDVALGSDPNSHESIRPEKQGLG